MNIFVETRVAPKIIFEKEDPILMAGEIALEKELSGARMGDGVNPWSKLSVLEVPKDTLDKWYTLINSATNSHLVTLPDINFAYTTVNIDSNPLIEETIDVIIRNKNYFSLLETSSQNINNHYDTLTVDNSEITDFLFFTDPNYEKIDRISRLGFVGKTQNETRYYLLEDKNAQDNIKILQTSLSEVVSTLSAVNDKIFNEQNGILKYLKPYVYNNESKKAESGLVPEYSGVLHSNYFLNVSGQWKAVPLHGGEMPLSSTSDKKTVASAIVELQNKKTPIAFTDTANAGGSKPEKIFVCGPTTANTSEVSTLYTNSKVYISKNNVLFGAAYNDYAEARQTNGVSAGRVVVENGDDTLSISTERLMLGGNIVSDTYGMLIGETDKAKTPIALCGRVLAYPFEDKEEYYPGAPVCTGPNGTVSLMSKDEVLHYPECIIGYVSAIPSYEEWNGKKVKGRIWIKVI